MILGTDDIASAVAHALVTAGYPTVLARDAAVPVLRRAMSFDDALEFGAIELAGVHARAALDTLALARLLQDGRFLPVTALPPDDLLCLGLVRGVIDARMRRHQPKADLRPLAGFAIGLGPGFEAGGNVHIAVETAPESAGEIVRAGPTLAAHGRSDPIAGIGRERFTRAPMPGCWTTSHAIGAAVQAGEVIGTCGEVAVRAPLAGCLRGLVRSGIEVTAGVKLLEVDPRGAAGQWDGIPPRPARIAAATLQALREIEVRAVITSSRGNAGRMSRRLP
ncbi:hypothetical protein [Rhodovastum atsumiense]|uniref:EF2563 family selenium-dependent molybdenum hydroxylase system protein n=1 Tax=Rhodovastum atsumiense TaxID=504468 RepID=A0A5M6J1X8_9PROT|nr:hypothetical protein [Rhodovastum atsumiense]KAA5613635.1 hypothetical protein F1189_04265 [Rhodovastum atsumiense]